MTSFDVYYIVWMNAVINRDFSPCDVEWSIVSGPGTMVRGEDDFGSADWTATVTATAESGEVVVEARFNEDAIQPRFVLPIVQMRTIPVRAFVVKAPPGETQVPNSRVVGMVEYANRIYDQVGIRFNLLSISRDVGAGEGSELIDTVELIQ